jgi:hypothetical protein
VYEKKAVGPITPIFVDLSATPRLPPNFEVSPAPGGLSGTACSRRAIARMT